MIAKAQAYNTGLLLFNVRSHPFNTMIHYIVDTVLERPFPCVLRVAENSILVIAG
jgi:hypothetical protein